MKNMEHSGKAKRHKVNNFAPVFHNNRFWLVNIIRVDVFSVSGLELCHEHGNVSW